LILKARNLRPEFRYLNIRLQLEKQRLWNWSEGAGIIGFLEDKQDGSDASVTGLNRHLILDVISEIQLLLTKFVKVQGRYQEISSEEVSSSEELSKDSLQLSDEGPMEAEKDPATAQSDFMCRLPASETLMRKFIKRVQGSETVPKRLRWAVWDGGKFKELIDRLKEMNDCLMDLVDNSIKQQILRTTKDTSMILLGACNKADDLRQLALALDYGGYNATSRTPLRIRSPQQISQESTNSKELLYLARFKELNESMDDDTSDKNLSGNFKIQQSPEQMKSSEIAWTDVELSDENSYSLFSSERVRSEGRFRGKTVWIEWKDYQPNSQNLSEPDPKIATRVRKLATLLRRDEKPAAFCVPHCMGYFDDVKYNTQARFRMRRQRESNHPILPQDDDARNTMYFRFGFVFEKPPDVDPSTVSIDLLELLRSRPRPSLTHRMILAKTIANCIRYLHSVNWLHKGIRSSNILFFPSENSEISYAKPLLSGFDYARPASQKELTETPPSNTECDIYRHPVAQSLSGRKGYKRSFDFYSLGVVLIEIIEWRPIDRIVGLEGMETVTVMTALRVRKRLLNRGFLESVASNGGTLYERSVRYCLECNEGESGENVEMDAQLGENFYENVVKRLERIQC